MALAVTGSALSISSLIGILMLVGIVVTNAIVLLEFVIMLRKERGYSTYDALVEGGQTRVRPIMMTAVAAMLALVPLALGRNEGAIIASELGRVVIGGLFSSTLLTLVVVPVVYSLVEGAEGALLPTTIAWLNLVSGRMAVLTPVDMSSVKGWKRVVDNTSNSPLTFALNVPMQIEDVDQTRPAGKSSTRSRRTWRRA